MRLWREVKGSITLEASLVLPVILLSSCTLLLLSLFVYKQAALQQRAELAAERTAYAWDNSRKELATGSVAAGQHDSLYWRLTQDNVLNLFQFLLPTGAVKIALPSSVEQGIGQEPKGKLLKTADSLEGHWSGELSYRNLGLLRSAQAVLRSGFHAPLAGPPRQLEALATSYVIDPVETIRLVDLTRTFVQEIQGKMKPRRALQLMTDPKSVPDEPVRITSHAQAAAHLRTLVGGQATTLQVNPTTKREVDALDAQRVAHQAFYTFNEAQLRQSQMPKDVELLKSGQQVQGVVWHFFKLSKQQKVKLSQGLKQQLERQGIVVMIHE
ncbi:hypothetical protein RAC89_01730 [Paenibacillus sp. GD4]|uniref:hypothetical protein n=1 Tax=Paenibacillus sp. GD4 TaxID=3068890 RepID=UPI0027967839|nr:hypothetical protein [Paenibacillus sp. GD4]MDQ1909218.1 hypothetical protein [Paenibacillus sp. GD4]